LFAEPGGIKRRCTLVEIWEREEGLHPSSVEPPRLESKWPPNPRKWDGLSWLKKCAA
jgi:hypothetical protein